jgi:hypothetical protein
MFEQRKRTHALDFVCVASAVAGFAGASCTPNAPETSTPNVPVAALPSASATPATPVSSPPSTAPQGPPAADAPEPVKAAYLAKLVEDSPTYFKRIHSLYQQGPRANPIGKHKRGEIYDRCGIPAEVAQDETDGDRSGKLGSYQPDGGTPTATNAFFQELGTNGRTCATCHQPPSGMSVSLQNIQARYQACGALDPIFAPIDGADCPNLVSEGTTSPSYLGKNNGSGSRSFEESHSLILKKGLFRIFIAVPAGAEFTVSVVSDPYGCNTTANYDSKVDSTTGQTLQVVSVYRRPLVSTNLEFVLNTRIKLPDGGSNIMWDGREPTLAQQAIDATLGHAQALIAPTVSQVAQIVAFETGIFSAQVDSNTAHSLTDLGALGGPRDLADDPAPGTSDAGTIPIYRKWATLAGSAPFAKNREAIAHGEAIFNGQAKTFTISNVAGLNDIAAVGNPLKNASCSACHNQVFAGTDSFPGAQHDLGIGGDHPAFGGPKPSTDLPIFTVTCAPGTTTSYGGAVITTNDPGQALITGKCADIGKLSVAPLRGLAAHAPYFSDGSAKTLDDVVGFYDKRFGIHFTAQEKADLVAFLNAL